MKTYDIVFSDSSSSNSKGFRMTKENAIFYVKNNNQSNNSYFADYKGGIVEVVCNETGEVVYQEDIN